MSKMITFVICIFILGTYLSMIIDDGMGMASSRLTQNIDADDTTINVASTTGFLTADMLVIESEKIVYTGITATSFTGCSRGYDGTIAKSHVINSKGIYPMAYSPESSILNDALGFSPGALSAVNGWTAIVTVPLNFFTRTLPNVLSFNFPFLQGGMAILGYFFLAMSIGILISLAIALIYGLGSLLKR
jgi:hypothetical protein